MPADSAQIISAFAGSFSAFILFVVGQIVISSQKRQERILEDLNETTEYLSLLLTTMLRNIELAKVMKARVEPVSIDIGRLSLLPPSKPILKIIGLTYFSISFIKLNVRIHVLNSDLAVINQYQDILSDLAKQAILTQKQDAFRATLQSNLANINAQTAVLQTSLEEGIKEISGIFDEMAFVKQYYEGFFPKKLYLRMRMWSDPLYYQRSTKRPDVVPPPIHPESNLAPTGNT
jgi:hypothetical protein